MAAQKSLSSGRYRFPAYEMESLACSFLHTCEDPELREEVENCVSENYKDINNIRLKMYAEINEIITKHQRSKRGM